MKLSESIPFGLGNPRNKRYVRTLGTGVGFTTTVERWK